MSSTPSGTLLSSGSVPVAPATPLFHRQMSSEIFPSVSNYNNFSASSQLPLTDPVQLASMMRQSSIYIDNNSNNHNTHMNNNSTHSVLSMQNSLPNNPPHLAVSRSISGSVLEVKNALGKQNSMIGTVVDNTAQVNTNQAYEALPTHAPTASPVGPSRIEFPVVIPNIQRSTSDPLANTNTNNNNNNHTMEQKANEAGTMATAIPASVVPAPLNMLPISRQVSSASTFASLTPKHIASAIPATPLALVKPGSTPSATANTNNLGSVYWGKMENASPRAPLTTIAPPPAMMASHSTGSVISLPHIIAPPPPLPPCHPSYLLPVLPTPSPSGSTKLPILSHRDKAQRKEERRLHVDTSSQDAFQNSLRACLSASCAQFVQCMPTYNIEDHPQIVQTKQYQRLMKRVDLRKRRAHLRHLRMKHLSRQLHASRRMRGPGGRFLTKEERAKLLKEQEQKQDEGEAK